MLVAMLAVATANAQQPASGRVSGTVTTTDATPQPVRRALVVLTGAEILTNVSVVTDDQGRFDVSGVPPGRVTVTASKAAFLTTPYGATRPGRPGTPLSVEAGQHVRDVIVRLPRGAVITGVVHDARGEPLSHLPITIQRASLVASSGGYVSLSETLHTDDRGVYRAFGLQPGSYVVAATPERGRGGVERHTDAEVDATLQRIRQRGSRPAPTAAAPAPLPAATADYAPVFYPGTAIAADAAAVTVAAGEERRGIDFVVDLQPSVNVRGLIATIDGSALPDVYLMMIVTGPPLPVFDEFATNIRAAARGAFSFTNVPPGRYLLSAVARAAAPAESSGPQPRWGQVLVDVRGDDLTGVAITLRPALSLTGRVEFEASKLAPPADRATMRVGLTKVNAGPLNPVPYVDGISADGGPPPPATVGADGAFTLSGIVPGTYSVTSSVPRAMGPSGWWLKSAMTGTRDLLDDPLEVSAATSALPDAVVVTFSDRHPELTGTLQSAAGQPASEFFVIVFPTERRWWAPGSRRVRATRPASDGRFSVLDLPAGDYFVAALTDVEADEWKSATFLDQLIGAAVKVTIRDGERTFQDLRLR
jgi:hypothetical protein